ncbi:hypothetical protein NMG60_11001478 [Bertholletia excelsa]
MLGKKTTCVKKLMRKAKAIGRPRVNPEPPRYQRSIREGDDRPPLAAVPAGFLPVYVGEERKRLVVPVGYLNHPLFRMLLEKVYDEFGFEQGSALVFPCSVKAFQEVVTAVEGGCRQFQFGKLVEKLI